MNDEDMGGIVLNPSCSSNCVFCEPKKTVTKSEMKEQEVKVLKNLMDFKKQGLGLIEISGSDPIEYDKIIQLIRYIKRIGFRYVQLSTHGKDFSDEGFLNDIISAGLDKVRIPLYGSDAKVHDAVTKTPGSFDATLKGIKLLLNRSEDIQIQISCLIMQQNKENLIDLIKLMSRLKVEDFYFSVPCVANKDYSYYIPFKDLGMHVKKAFDFASKIGYKVNFMEIPFCVFGQFDESIDNSCSPPNLGRYCQPPEIHRSPVKDLPLYRIKKKVSICNSCECSRICDGFFVNDISIFGTGNLKPII